MALHDHLKLLHDNGLHTNVQMLGSLLVSMSENSSELLSFQHRYQTYVLYGDSLYYMKEYKKAEIIFRKALQVRKTFAKSKGKTQPFPVCEGMSDIDIKYKTHLCLMKLRQPIQATAVLESISAKQRTPLVNFALAKLFQNSGNEKGAMTAYKEVLRECPFALEAALGLMALGLKTSEVAAMMIGGGANVANIDWLSTWVKAHGHVHSRELSKAIAAFKHLDLKTPLRDNLDTLVTLAEVYSFQGDFQNAIMTFERIHAIDPMQLRGMDVYAGVLAHEKQSTVLESLAAKLILVSEFAPEPWIVMGYYCLTTKKAPKTAGFAYKAVHLAPDNVEALLLKGKVLLNLKKHNDAITQFGEAYRIAPYRFEPHKGLVDTYMSMHRMREAATIASSACKHLGQSCRALTLYASVLIEDPLSCDKAKVLLEKALKQDPTHLEAVYLLATAYEQQQLYEKGIELLRKHVEQQTSCRLHQMLGDLFSKTSEHERALHHFSIALDLDPSNHKAVEGSQRVERPTDGSEYFDVDDLCYSDNEPDYDSEIENPWSDPEFL